MTPFKLTLSINRAFPVGEVTFLHLIAISWHWMMAEPTLGFFLLIGGIMRKTVLMVLWSNNEWFCLISLLRITWHHVKITVWGCVCFILQWEGTLHPITRTNLGRRATPIKWNKIRVYIAHISMFVRLRVMLDKTTMFRYNFVHSFGPFSFITACYKDQ